MDERYDIERHRHVFAAWVAGRAATGREEGSEGFDVKNGRRWLEAVGFTESLDSPASLPSPNKIDEAHRGWRSCVIVASHEDRTLKGEPTSVTHGQAAKLINVYLKTRFVCGGHHDHPNVGGLHPPLDRLLLQSLKRKKIGCLDASFTAPWSQLNSEEYEAIIARIRMFLGDAPLWEIERHWKGYQ
jgi:hypothetical protein